MSLLWTGQGLTHPFVSGEISLGNLKQRQAVLGDLTNPTRAVVARIDEVLEFIGRNDWAGTGLSYVDAHLLPSALLCPKPPYRLVTSGFEERRSASSSRHSDVNLRMEMVVRLIEKFGT